MAKLNRTAIQNYPRIEDETSLYHGFFDDSKVQPHIKELTDKQIDTIIIKSVKSANLKSSRAILNIKENISQAEINKIYQKQGKALFSYFVKYCGDPASTAYDCINQHYEKIAREQFRKILYQNKKNRTASLYRSIKRRLQKHTTKTITLNTTSIDDSSRFYKLVLKAFQQNKFKNNYDIEIPKLVIKEFGCECKKNNLIDKKGYFVDPFTLVTLFL